jgi:hypothetical protein
MSVHYSSQSRTWPTVNWPVTLGVKPRLGPKTRFLLLSDTCGFVDMCQSVKLPAGIHQHSHSWLQVSLRSMSKICFFP